jgi:hypothetical protein
MSREMYVQEIYMKESFARASVMVWACTDMPTATPMRASGGRSSLV